MSSGESVFAAFLVISALVAVVWGIYAFSVNGPGKPDPGHGKIQSFHAEAKTEYDEHKKHCQFNEDGRHCACGRY